MNSDTKVYVDCKASRFRRGGFILIFQSLDLEDEWISFEKEKETGTLGALHGFYHSFGLVSPRT